MMKNKKSASALISDLKRKTRKAYNSEDKIRIIIEGMRGETTIAELCRKESIHQANYYKWSKDFMEAGKRRLNGDTMREANTSEVHNPQKNDQSSQKVFFLCLKFQRSQNNSQAELILVHQVDDL